MSEREFELVLVLSGGNALGAFQAGVYEALHEADLEPDWIVGASIGAINGALIAGSAVDRRIATLTEFWRPHPAMNPRSRDPANPIEIARRTAAVSWTLGAGKPGLFGPLLSSLWASEGRALFETLSLAHTLEQAVDFDRLNRGPCRFTATAIDLASGDDVLFDSREQPVTSLHIRASAALPVTFPPVEVDGRLLVDAGLSANLPLDPVFLDPPSRPALIVAVDLLPLAQPVPTTLGEMAGRLQDLTFAAQSRRSLARWAAVYAGRQDVSLSLVRLAYQDQSQEVAGKAFDFSGPTIASRWLAGRQEGETLVTQVMAGKLAIGAPGLTLANI